MKKKKKSNKKRQRPQINKQDLADKSDSRLKKVFTSKGVRSVGKIVAFLFALIGAYSSALFIPSKVTVIPSVVLNGRESWLEVSNQSHFALSNLHASFQYNSPNWSPDHASVRFEFEPAHELTLKANHSTSIEMKPVYANTSKIPKNTRLSIDVIITYDYLFIEHEKTFTFKRIVNDGKIVAWIPAGARDLQEPDLTIKQKPVYLKGKDGKINPIEVWLESIEYSTIKE